MSEGIIVTIRCNRNLSVCFRCAIIVIVAIYIISANDRFCAVVRETKTDDEDDDDDSFRLIFHNEGAVSNRSGSIFY